MAEQITIETLWKRYKNKSKISSLTGHDWKTVAKAVKSIESGIPFPERKSHPSKLDPYKENILELLEKGLTGVRVHEEIMFSGVKIGYSTVRDYIARIKQREDVFVRINTLPGEEAQVDFGYVGLTLDNYGKRRRTWVFCITLSYSRKSYYEKVYDQKVETFIKCHINAFNEFKGVPEYIKIDNLKSAVLKTNFYESIYQELYKKFADYYKFKPLPCRIREPNDKGKIESGVKYVKTNFFAGRTFVSGNDTDTRLRDWTTNKCNKRIHGTTRRIPDEVFESEEKTKLIALPESEFNISKIGSRKVYHDCHVYFEYNYYSVPFEYVGETAEVESKDNLIKISHNGKIIATHAKLEGRGNFSTNAGHYPKYKQYSSTEIQEEYQAKMKDLGIYAEQMFFLVIENNPKDWRRTVQGILSLGKEYQKEIVNLACKRAIAHDVRQYSIIKNICGNGSYAMPVEFNFENEDINLDVLSKIRQVSNPYLLSDNSNKGQLEGKFGIEFALNSEKSKNY